MQSRGIQVDIASLNIPELVCQSERRAEYCRQFTEKIDQLNREWESMRQEASNLTNSLMALEAIIKDLQHLCAKMEGKI